MNEVAPPERSDRARHVAAFTCGYCGEINVAAFDGARVGHSWSDTFHHHDNDLVWYPERVAGKDYPDVPEHIAGAADEAHQAFSISGFRGAVLLARSVVEATAKAKDIENGNLNKKIDELYGQKHIREHVRDAAHEVRHLGNDMAHGDFVLPVSREEAEEILTLMDEVLEEVFQSPARVAKRQAAREAKAAQAGGEAAGS